MQKFFPPPKKKFIKTTCLFHQPEINHNTVGEEKYIICSKISYGETKLTTINTTITITITITTTTTINTNTE